MRPGGRAALLGLGLLAALGGCRDRLDDVLEEAQEASRLGDAPATSLGHFDPEATRQALQGYWVVRRSGRTLFEFVVDGERARAIDRRFSLPRAIEGELVVRSESGFGIRTPEGVRYYYSFVQEGGKTYMGLGDAVKGAEGQPFTARLGAWETVVHGEDGVCRYVKTWAGQATEREVACGFEDKGTHRVFHYEAADPFRDDRMKRFELHVVGGWLMSRELAESEAEKRPLSEAPGAGEIPAAPADAPAPEPEEEEAPEPEGDRAPDAAGGP